MYLVSVFDNKSGLVIGKEEVEEERKEITDIRELVERLEVNDGLKDAVV